MAPRAPKRKRTAWTSSVATRPQLDTAIETIIEQRIIISALPWDIATRSIREDTTKVQHTRRLYTSDSHSIVLRHHINLDTTGSGVYGFDTPPQTTGAASPTLLQTYLRAAVQNGNTSRVPEIDHTPSPSTATSTASSAVNDPANDTTPCHSKQHVTDGYCPYCVHTDSSYE